jgi:ABC-2 type transport system ATP-binding protein
VSFQASRGDIMGVIGPNGAGKTTLLRLAAGYLQPTRGSIRLGSMDSFRHSFAYRRHLGYLPERCPLYDDMTVGEYLHYRARLKGLNYRRARRRARDLAEQLGLTTVRGRLIGSLSLGCRRRTGVADALLLDPRLLLLDDPIANVDPVECERIAACVAHSAQHAVVLITGHALAQLGALCTRFLVLRDGRVAADVSRTEVAAGHDGVMLVVEVSGPAEETLRQMAANFAGGGKASVERQADGWWRVSWGVRPTDDTRDAVVAEVTRLGWRTRAVQVVAPALEARLADLVAGRGAAGGTPAAGEGA